jgi:hypothetical protein
MSTEQVGFLLLAPFEALEKSFDSCTGLLTDQAPQHSSNP